MKESIKIVLVALLLFLNAGLMFGQQTRIDLGDKYYDQYAYKKAIELYEEALDRKSTNWELYAKLGDCYYFLSDTKKALDNYDKFYNASIENKFNINNALLLRYAVCLHGEGRTTESIAIYNKLGESVKQKEESDLINSSLTKEEPLTSINSDSSDFGTFIFKNTLYFSSTRKNPEKEKRFNKRLYKWNEEPFLDIYEAKIDENNGSISMNQTDSKSSSLSNINTIAHQGSVTLTKKGDTMYYSSGDVKNNKLVYNNRGTSNLKLKRATWDSSINKWVVKKEDSIAMNYFDIGNYSIGNPALSPDNKRLYFVTCAPFSEAQGQTDIYYVNILNNGKKFGKVTSVLGVNTAGREGFPFIASDGTLYFSSDGVQNIKQSDNIKELGLGLLDIYKVENLDNIIQKYETEISHSKDSIEIKDMTNKLGSYLENELKVEHLKGPFNSEMDDFAFYIDKTNLDSNSETYAYFSSNRSGGLRNDDIYRAKVKIEQFKTIQVDVKDASTEQLMGNALIDLIDSEGKLLETAQDSTGLFEFKVLDGEQYRIRGYASRYYDDLKEFNSSEIKDHLVLKLKPFPCEISINHIEFRFNKDSLDTRVKIDSLELNKLLELKNILLANPEIKIKIESYTDSRGPKEYNLGLSERRANSTKNYLIEQGVNENQIISAKGFGENCPIVSDEEINKFLTIKEREAEHAKNRRSRFILDCQHAVESCQDYFPR